MATKQNGCLTLIFKLFAAAGATTAKPPLPYRTKQRFITANEAQIYDALARHHPGRVVFANVLLRDIVEVTPLRERSAWQSAHNRIAQRQVDFVVCDTATFRPLLAIELDDRTHDTEKRRKGDALENEIFEAAGLRLLRLRGHYQRQQLLDLVEAALQVTQS